MFMTSELTHIRNLFLKGNLDSFDFRQGKLHIHVSKMHDSNVFKGHYFVQIDYNKCEAWNVDSFETPKEAWDSVQNSLDRIQEILDNPSKMLEERIKKMYWVTREQHTKTIKEICE